MMVNEGDINERQDEYLSNTFPLGSFFWGYSLLNSAAIPTKQTDY